MGKQLKHIATIYWEQTIQYLPENPKRFGLIGNEKAGDCLCRGQDILLCKNQSNSAIAKEWREIFSTKNLPDWVEEEIVKIEIKRNENSD